MPTKTQPGAHIRPVGQGRKEARHPCGRAPGRSAAGLGRDRSGLKYRQGEALTGIGIGSLGYWLSRYKQALEVSGYSYGSSLAVLSVGVSQSRFVA